MKRIAVAAVGLVAVLGSASAGFGQDAAYLRSHGYSQTFWPNRGVETSSHYYPRYPYAWYFDKYYGSPYYVPDYHLYVFDNPYSYYPPPTPIGTFYGPPNLHVGMSIGPPNGSRILWPFIGAPGGAATVGTAGGTTDGTAGGTAGGLGGGPGWYGR